MLPPGQEKGYTLIMPLPPELARSCQISAFFREKAAKPRALGMTFRFMVIADKVLPALVARVWWFSKSQAIIRNKPEWGIPVCF